MDGLTIAIVAALILNLAILAWFLISLRGRAKEQSDRLESALQLFKAELIGKQTESLFSLKGAVDTAHKTLNDRLSEGSSTLDRRMAVFGEIENKLGKLASQTASMEEIGRNIQSLSELLRPPKLRGQLGEQFLENLLAQILPRDMFDMQHRFREGSRVDAVVKIGDRLIPIDAKFPREAFERLNADNDNESAKKEFARTLKKHIDDIANKYILPQEGTTEFAVMYIPAEAVYYQLVSQETASSLSYAFSRKVIPSSPGHLYAFLASLSAIYAEVRLTQAGLTQGSRQLVAAIQDLMDTTSTLDKLHDRMEGSFRQLSIAFEKARKELGDVRLGLERLHEPLETPPLDEPHFEKQSTDR